MEYITDTRLQEFQSQMEDSGFYGIESYHRRAAKKILQYNDQNVVGIMFFIPNSNPTQATSRIAIYFLYLLKNDK